MRSDIKFHEIFRREIFHEIYREIFQKFHDDIFRQYTHLFNIFHTSNITIYAHCSSLSLCAGLLAWFACLNTLLPARRYASAGLRQRRVCPDGRPDVRHTPILCLTERKQDREMYII